MYKMETNVIVPPTGLVDVNGNELKSEETIKAENQPTYDEERAATLKATPGFVTMQKKVEKTIKQLERNQPNLSKEDRLQMAAKIVVSSKPKPTEQKNNYSPAHPKGNRLVAGGDATRGRGHAALGFRIQRHDVPLARRHL